MLQVDYMMVQATVGLRTLDKLKLPIEKIISWLTLEVWMCSPHVRPKGEFVGHLGRARVIAAPFNSTAAFA